MRRQGGRGPLLAVHWALLRPHELCPIGASAWPERLPPMRGPTSNRTRSPSVSSSCASVNTFGPRPMPFLQAVPPGRSEPNPGRLGRMAERRWRREPTGAGVGGLEPPPAEAGSLPRSNPLPITSSLSSHPPVSDRLALAYKARRPPRAVARGAGSEGRTHSCCLEDSRAKPLTLHPHGDASRSRTGLADFADPHLAARSTRRVLRWWPPVRTERVRSNNPSPSPRGAATNERRSAPGPLDRVLLHRRTPYRI